MKTLRPLEFLFRCHECGQEQRVPLDSGGHWEGNCSAPTCEAPLGLTVDPEAWHSAKQMYRSMGAVWPYADGPVH